MGRPRLSKVGKAEREREGKRDRRLKCALGKESSLWFPGDAAKRFKDDDLRGVFVEEGCYWARLIEESSGSGLRDARRRMAEGRVRMEHVHAVLGGESLRWL